MLTSQTARTSLMPSGHELPAVLFVDDEPKIRKYFLIAFKDYFPILTAGSAREAETILLTEHTRVGVLISDQRMPGTTGVQLLGQIKTRYPLIVRLLTTAYADLESAIAAVNRGEVYRYLLKPWNIPELRSELLDAVQLHLQRCHEQELLQARRHAMLTLASHIAHELRTPLATIRIAAHNLQDYWADLVATYRCHAVSDQAPPPLDGTLLAALAGTPREIQEMVDRANMLINLLLANAREEPDPHAQYPILSLSRCVYESLHTYPFRSGERQRVCIEGEDFHVRGSQILLSFTLYNLLGNALDAIYSAGKGEILIRLAPDTDVNRLYFQDTGSGIPSEVLPHVFDEFFSSKASGYGTGMGLPFCKRVMTALGGTIQCRSKPGESTEVELAFPSVPLGESAISDR